MSSKNKIQYEAEEIATPTSSKRKGDDGSDASYSGETPSSSKGAKVTPLIALRSGYLSVSDFVHQVWCEKQMVYNLTSSDIKESHLSIKGKDMHLERDLEVNDYVSIDCTGREDRYAIHFLNLLSALYEVQNQLTTGLREVPIFGMIHGIFLMGRIDELRVDYEDFSIDLVEFKTRKWKETASEAQILKHKVQLMLYKKMFDDLVFGDLHLEGFTNNLGLDLSKPLGGGIKEHIEENLGFLREMLGDDVWTLQFLLDRIASTAKFLPFISRCFIEFAWQKDGQIFHLKEIHYDLAWIERILKPCLSYWHGEREAEGVDIEESWKCKHCEFNSECTWKKSMKNPWARHRSKCGSFP